LGRKLYIIIFRGEQSYLAEFTLSCFLSRASMLTIAYFFYGYGKASKIRTMTAFPYQSDIQWLAAEPGFEPGLRDPKSPVLPLHNSATLKLVPKVGFEPTRELPLNSF
jgi:hypothetical protein